MTCWSMGQTKIGLFVLPVHQVAALGQFMKHRDRLQLKRTRAPVACISSWLFKRRRLTVQIGSYRQTRHFGTLDDTQKPIKKLATSHVSLGRREVALQAAVGQQPVP